jgi:hypothetical protein
MSICCAAALAISPGVSGSGSRGRSGKRQLGTVDYLDALLDALCAQQLD